MAKGRIPRKVPAKPFAKKAAKKASKKSKHKKGKSKYQTVPSTSGILNLKSKRHYYLYKAAITNKKIEDFGCTPAELQQFIVVTQRHAEVHGWSRTTGRRALLLDIPNDLNDPRQGFKNLLRRYGDVQINHVRKFVMTFSGTKSRINQDDQFLFEYLWNCLSAEGIMKVNMREHLYMVKNQVSGLMLLKVIMDISRLQTNATVIRLKGKLNDLDSTILALNWDIEKFNETVMDIVTKLTQNGHEAPDLYFQVLKAYGTCPQETFALYIREIKNRFEEQPSGSNDDPFTLMEKALGKYTILKENNEWNTENELKQELLALQAKVKELTKARKKGGTRAKEPKKTPYKGKKAFSKFSKKDRRDDGEWRTRKPKKGEPTKQNIGGKMFYWCSTDTGASAGNGCNKWTVHKPSQCNRKNILAKWKGKNGNGKRDSSKREKKGLKVQEATMHCIDCSDDSSSSDEEMME